MAHVPLWVAPNMVTLVGLLVNAACTAVLVMARHPEPPAWTCAVAAAGLFVYQTLDAIDGKQVCGAAFG